MSMASKIVEKVGEMAVDIPGQAPKVIAGAAIAVGSSVVGYAAGFKKADKGKKEFGKKQFELGLKVGNKNASKKAKKMFYDPYLAKIALANYISQADDKITNKEQKILDRIVKDFEEKDGELPKNIKKELQEVVSKVLTFADVEKYLDSLDVNGLRKYQEIIDSLTNLNIKKTYKEKIRIEEFNNYIERRKNESVNQNIEAVLENNNNTNDEFLLLTNDEIEKTVEEYSLKYSLLETKFERKTKLTKNEIGLVIIATALQLTRIYLVNQMSIKERANKGTKENVIKSTQKEVLERFGYDKDLRLKRYYAPMKMIISNAGVPYDAQKYEEGKNLGLFKGKERGVNHRFATLGHDPLVGLLVGTINIMTNTITTTKNKIPTTYHVGYTKDFKDPCIMSNKASFIKAVDKSIERSKEDIKPLVAAFIKQLFHIASDTYTIAGIQLPGSSLVFSENTVESMTEVISLGDVVKMGSSFGLASFINTIIQLLHLALINDEGGDYSNKIHQVKTKKIIDYSNYIATYSNVVTSTITERYDKLDLAGLAIITRKLFNDINFLYDIKYEFINEGLKKEFEI